MIPFRNRDKKIIAGGVVAVVIFAGIGITLLLKDDFSGNNEGEIQQIMRPAISVGELLVNLPYDEEVTLYGVVQNFGELICPCFDLVSGNKKVTVWFGGVVREDGTTLPQISSVERIQNGSKVFVVGDLKIEAAERGPNNFWAIDIEPDTSGIEREGYNQIEVALSNSPRCIITGCNNELCTNSEVQNSCVKKVEHACYTSATCERQPNGICGWTSTEELQICVERARR